MQRFVQSMEVIKVLREGWLSKCQGTRSKHVIDIDINETIS